jgi:hypothetical protein
LSTNPHARSRNGRKKRPPLFAVEVVFVLFMLEIFTFRTLIIACFKNSNNVHTFFIFSS